LNCNFQPESNTDFRLEIVASRLFIPEVTIHNVIVTSFSVFLSENICHQSEKGLLYCSNVFSGVSLILLSITYIHLLQLVKKSDNVIVCISIQSIISINEYLSKAESAQIVQSITQLLTHHNIGAILVFSHQLFNCVFSIFFLG